VQCQGPGYDNALALSPAKGVRKALHILGGKTHQTQQLRHTIGTLFAAFDAFDDQQWLPHNVKQVHTGVERSKGILKDHLHITPQQANLALWQRSQIDNLAGLGAKQDLPRSRLKRAQNAPGCGSLTTATLTYQAQRFSFIDEETNVVNSTNVPNKLPSETLLDGEILLEVLYFQEYLAA
jgi:hypothetical protein